MTNIDATAYLAFCVKVGNDHRDLLEGRALYDFNESTGADLGFLSAGQFENEELFVTVYCEGAETLESKIIDLSGFGEGQLSMWNAQIHNFLNRSRITPLTEAAFRLIADLED